MLEISCLSFLIQLISHFYGPPYCANMMCRFSDTRPNSDSPALLFAFPIHTSELFTTCIAGRPIRILQIVTPLTVGKQPTWPVHWRPVSKPPPRFPSSEQSQAGETRKYCQIAMLDVKAYDLHYWMGSIEAPIQCINMIPNLPIRRWHRIPCGTSTRFASHFFF